MIRSDQVLNFHCRQQQPEFRSGSIGKNQAQQSERLIISWGIIISVVANECILDFGKPHELIIGSQLIAICIG